MIPEPPSNRAYLYENTDERLWGNFDDVSDADYNDYLDECIDKGFTVDAEKDSNTYKAFNEDGFCLDMSHYGNTLSLDLEAPKQLATIAWPNSAAGNKLPVPKSTIGEFSFEREDSFFVYVGEMTKDDYNEYVEACSNKGFSVDYNKGDTYYQADDSDGWHIALTYEGNSIMSIRIDGPDDADTTTADDEQSATMDEASKPDETSKEDISFDDAGIDGDFKAAMDSYEEFMDGYVEFMKDYNDNPTDIGLIAEYAKFIGEYAEFTKEFSEWQDADLNTEEIKYYLEVQNRVTQKMLEITE